MLFIVYLNSNFFKKAIIGSNQNIERRCSSSNRSKYLDGSQFLWWLNFHAGECVEGFPVQVVHPFKWICIITDLHMSYCISICVISCSHTTAEPWATIGLGITKIVLHISIFQIFSMLAIMPILLPLPIQRVRAVNSLFIAHISSEILSIHQSLPLADPLKPGPCIPLPLLAVIKCAPQSLPPIRNWSHWCDIAMHSLLIKTI